MKIRTTLVTTALASATLSALQPFNPSALCADVPAPRPNIIIILADDFGWSDLGCYNPGTYYETPNLDRLARQSVRFTNGYSANPVCSPTRFSLQTGRYPTRGNATYWFGSNPPSGLSFDFAAPEINQFIPNDYETLAEGLKKAGYQTAFIGKWHLGQPGPEKRGYELNDDGLSQNTPKKNRKNKNKDKAAGKNTDDEPPAEFPDRALAPQAIAFLRQMAADKSRPFFLSHNFYLTHTPIQAPADLVQKYKDKARKLGLTDGNDFSEEEQTWPTPNAGPRKIRTRQSNPTYAAMVEQMDTAVGQILAELDALGVAGNTLVMFISDNGGLSTTNAVPTSNLPLRGGKGWLYEGGIRVPFMIRWPAAIKGGSTNDTPIMTIDVLPTAYAAAGVPLPAKKPDGVNLLPLLQNNTPLSRDALYWHFPHYGGQGGFPGAAIRVGDWKLIERFTDGRVHLYNLRDDLAERTDLAAEDPARVAALRSRLHAWYRETGASFLQQKPGGPKPWRPASD